MILVQNKISFLKRYLFTTDIDHKNIYEYEIVRWQSSVAYEELPISLTEYFSLPIFMREVLMDNQKKIAENKASRIS